MTEAKYCTNHERYVKCKLLFQAHISQMIQVFSGINFPFVFHVWCKKRMQKCFKRMYEWKGSKEKINKIKF